MIESRLYILHVFVLPAVMAALIAAHLALVVRQHHTQFRGPGRREGNVVGTPMWPGYALRSLGLLFAVAAVLVLLGGLVQINPVWQWGPYELDRATNGAQPDWYLGWLIGGAAAHAAAARSRSSAARSCPTPSGAASRSRGRLRHARRVAVPRAAPACATAPATTSSTARATTRGAPPSASPSSAGWR